MMRKSRAAQDTDRKFGSLPIEDYKKLVKDEQLGHYEKMQRGIMALLFLEILHQKRRASTKGPKILIYSD